MFAKLKRTSAGIGLLLMVTVMVELLSPVVNGRTLSYDAVRVGDTPVGDFDCDGNAHLFIDNSGVGTVGGMRPGRREPDRRGPDRRD